jgi:hypothetical protein
MREDLGNHGGMFGGGEDRQGAAAVGTLFNKEQTWLAEIGTSGYSQCQVEEDSGSDVPQIRRLSRSKFMSLMT